MGVRLSHVPCTAADDKYGGKRGQGIRWQKPCGELLWAQGYFTEHDMVWPYLEIPSTTWPSALRTPPAGGADTSVGVSAISRSERFVLLLTTKPPTEKLSTPVGAGRQEMQVILAVIASRLRRVAQPFVVVPSSTPAMVPLANDKCSGVVLHGVPHPCGARVGWLPCGLSFHAETVEALLREGPSPFHHLQLLSPSAAAWRSPSAQLSGS